MMRVEVALAESYAVGESPVWDSANQRLHFIDIFGQRICRYDPSSGEVSTLHVDGIPGAIALRPCGGYLAGIGKQLALVDLEGGVTPLASLIVGDRVNDGRCDPKGRFVVGTMDPAERPGGAALYQLREDGSLIQLLSGLSLSNGLDWSPDGQTLYHVDTTSRRVTAFDYDPDSGSLGQGRAFAEISGQGRPDGLSVDAEGGVWVVIARAGAVHRYDPSGTLEAVIEIPVPTVTSCAFGGPDLDRLFVTSSRALLPEPQRMDYPAAGFVFVIEGLGVRGKQTVLFGEA